MIFSGDKEQDMEDLNLSSHVPVDDNYGQYRYRYNDDENSAYSIASSQWNFSWENGRLYHHYRSGHIFPYDTIAVENEQVLHAMMLCLLDDRYFIVPIDGSTIKNVIDVGCGLGLWAENMAERYPNAHIVGIDTAPREVTVFPNCEFLVMDASQDWVLNNPNMKFDLVNLRSLFASLGVEEWPNLYRNCFEHTAPGGWIQQFEVEIELYCDDDSEIPNSQIRHLCDLSRLMSRRIGRDFHVSDRMKSLIEAAGFVDVQETKYKLPLGPWSAEPKYKEIGKFYERFYKTGLQGWLLHTLTTGMGYKPEQVNEECLKAFAEIDQRTSHYYFNMMVVIGRKP